MRLNPGENAVRGAGASVTLYYRDSCDTILSHVNGAGSAVAVIIVVVIVLVGLGLWCIYSLCHKVTTLPAHSEGLSSYYPYISRTLPYLFACLAGRE